MKKVLSISLLGSFSTLLLLTTQRIYSQQNPGGVTGAVAWYKANAGITVTAGLVSQWNDNTVNANHGTQGTAINRPDTVNNNANFNPAVTFLVPSTVQFLNTGSTGFPTAATARSVFFCCFLQ